jgi:sarcosine oxidase
LLLTAGAWIGSLVPELKRAFSVERQVLYWFTPLSDSTQFAPAECPIHLWESAPRKYFYGFPDFGDGVKIALHHDGEAAEPDALRREVSGDEISSMRELVQRFLPGAHGALRATEVCMYTNTPDEHFWIDRHPQHAKVLIASPCSGHGFKFASVIGEVLAELLLSGTAQFDLSLFRRRQF